MKRLVPELRACRARTARGRRRRAAAARRTSARTASGRGARDLLRDAAADVVAGDHRRTEAELARSARARWRSGRPPSTPRRGHGRCLSDSPKPRRSGTTTSAAPSSAAPPLASRHDRPASRAAGPPDRRLRGARRPARSRQPVPNAASRRSLSWQPVSTGDGLAERHPGTGHGRHERPRPGDGAGTRRRRRAGRADEPLRRARRGDRGRARRRRDRPRAGRPRRHRGVAPASTTRGAGWTGSICWSTTPGSGCAPSTRGS